MNRLSLSSKTLVALTVLVLLAVGSAGAVLYFGWRAHRADQAISHEVADIVAAGDLQVTLLQQRLAVGAFIVSGGDRGWLEAVEAREADFRGAMRALQDSAERPEERELIAGVARAEARYDEGRRRVVKLFGEGKTGEAHELFLGEMTDLYRATVSAAERVVQINRGDVHAALASNGREMDWLGRVMTASAGLTLLLGLGTVWLLYSGVFHPIRKIARQARELVERHPDAPPPEEADEMLALGYYFRTLTSEVAEARGELEESRRRVSHQERMAEVGRVVAHVSHEMKNALTAIGGFARMIERRPEDHDRVREGAQVIQRSAARMEHLVRETMDFSKPMRVELAVGSFNGLVREALAGASPQLPGGIHVELDLDERLPRVAFDAEHMVRVVGNLLGNALEAMGDGPGRLVVRTRMSGDGVALDVSDTGPGIPAEVGAHIFEPFFTTKRKGTGLGLAICRQIVASHGGELSFASEPGKGATFTIELPGSSSPNR